MYCGPKQHLKLDRRLRQFHIDARDLNNQKKEYSGPVPPFARVEQIILEPKNCLQVAELFQ